MQMNAIQSRRRSLGISFLSILHMLGGVGVFVIMFMPSAPDEKLPLGVPIYLPFIIGFLGVVLFLSGIGMWFGKTWGWWLSIFHYTLAIVRHSAGAVITAATINLLRPQSLKVVFRIAIDILIIYYLFRKNILQFFGFSQNPKAIHIVGTPAKLAFVTRL